MLERYPHSATITITTEGEDPNGIPASTKETLEIIGRYEPNSMNRTLNYTGRFFCERLDILKENPYALNGQKLEVLGRIIGISQAWNYQTYCELWLD
jgi:hypothetical protein